MNFERAIMVKGKTRLESLLYRFNSKSQAKFYIEHNGGDFAEYEDEHTVFYEGLLHIQKVVSRKLKTTVLERSYLPSFLFDNHDLIVVVGQDGLVANTAKYVGTCPIMAVNPDTKRNAGILLPFNTENFHESLDRTLNEAIELKKITLAQATLNDGQKLLAFNDFYIGKSNHTSSRYNIAFGGKNEIHSSSGVIVSTGAGSTGWLSSVFNEHNGISKFMGSKGNNFDAGMKLDDDKLCFVVREPFNSPNTKSELVAGYINNNETLKIESNMPENGVIFSDGVIDDYLVFNSGSTLTVGTAKEKVNLVIE